MQPALGMTDGFLDVGSRAGVVRVLAHTDVVHLVLHLVVIPELDDILVEDCRP